MSDPELLIKSLVAENKQLEHAVDVNNHYWAETLKQRDEYKRRLRGLRKAIHSLVREPDPAIIRVNLKQALRDWVVKPGPEARPYGEEPDAK